MSDYRKLWTTAKRDYKDVIVGLKFKDDFGPALDEYASLTEELQKIQARYETEVEKLDPKLTKVVRHIIVTYESYLAKLKTASEYGKDTKELEKVLDKINTLIVDDNKALPSKVDYYYKRGIK